MATTTSPEVLAVRSALPRTTIVAATTFLLAGAIRLTAGAEELGLSAAFAVAFFVLAVAQIGYGVLLTMGSRRALSAPAVATAMSVNLGLIGLWLVATTTTVPIYPLMTGGYPVDVLDLGTILLQIVGVLALRRSLPQSTRGRVTLVVGGLVAAAWLIWVVIVLHTGLSN
jgi:hypothetical protein